MLPSICETIEEEAVFIKAASEVEAVKTLESVLAFTATCEFVTAAPSEVEALKT